MELDFQYTLKDGRRAKLSVGALALVFWALLLGSSLGLAVLAFRFVAWGIW